MGTSLLLGGIEVALLVLAMVLKLRSPLHPAGRWAGPEPGPAAGPAPGPGTEGSGVPAVPNQPTPTLTAAAEAEPEDESA
ncbi:MAG: hypothetical protein ACE149_11865 [Armatimonadota bacterium]